jgi:glycine oxidase
MADSPGIVVVGGGIVGCAIAYELARRGATVQVIEGRTAGMGATQAAAGILAPYLEMSPSSALLALAVRSLNLFDEFVDRVQADSGMAIPYRRSGTLNAALTEDGLRDLEEMAVRLQTQGVAHSLLDGAVTRQEEPHLSHDVLGGLIVPGHGFVGAAALVQAVATAARRHGARLLEGRRACRVVPAGNSVSVETDHGTVTAAAVVLAAGSWSAQVEIAGVSVRPPVRPVRGQLLRLVSPVPMLRRVVWTERCYLVPWDDGTLLVGATVEDAGFDERTTVAGVRDLAEAACEIAPGAWTAGFLEARAGLRPASADLLPIVGSSTVFPNVMYATAHYRNGILMAPLTAVLVADAMLENRVDPDLTVLSPQRFGDL